MAPQPGPIDQDAEQPIRQPPWLASLHGLSWPWVRPSAHLSSPTDRSNAQLLATILLVAVPVYAAFVLAGRFYRESSTYFAYLAVSFAFLMVAYAFSRSRHYRVGLWVFILQSLGVAVIASWTLQEPIFTLTSLVGLIMASLFLAPGVVLSLVFGVGLLTLSIDFVIGPDDFFIPGLWLMAAITSLVYTYTRHRNETLIQQQVEQLTLSSERYRSLVESQTELVLRFTPDYRITYANEACAAALGIPIENIIGLRLMEVLPMHDRESAHSLLATKANAQGIIELEYSYKRPDQTLRWLHWNAQLIRDDAGQLLEYQAVARDITEQKLAKQALQEREQRYRVLASNLSNMMVVLIDPTMKVLTADGPLLDQLADSQELKGDTVAVMMDTETTNQHLPHLRSMLAGEGSELEWQQLDFILRSVFVPIKDDQGTVLYGMIMTHDITERRRIEEARMQVALERERAELLQQFVDDISHDLKTPLTVLRTNLFMLRKTIEDDSSRLRIKRAEAQIDRLERMINDMLVLSRLDRPSDFALHTELFELTEMVSRLVASEQAVATIHHQTLQLHCDEPSILFFGDAEQIERAFSNLIDNALRYTPEGGSIDVSLKRVGSEILFSVQDTGAGIPEEELGQIFERFYRGRKHRPSDGGSGLGLSITQRIVELHNGRIEVTSELGKGSRFEIHLSSRHITPSVSSPTVEN
ncbi:MAG: PAS domain S-box protein [Chloroflexi bacterium]|nr:PAS domain S-box protein [Chloroflexota bacterium]